jgi:hypothetical protein
MGATRNSPFGTPYVASWTVSAIAERARASGPETGWPLARQWQAENHPLAPGKRLAPKIPFFLGGKYSVENLWEVDAVEGMRAKADLAMQTKDLRDGAKVPSTC